MAKRRLDISKYDKARSYHYSDDEKVCFCFVSSQEKRLFENWRIRETREFRYYKSGKEVVCAVYRCPDYNYISEYIVLEKGRGGAITADPFEIKMGREVIPFDKFAERVYSYNPDILIKKSFDSYVQAIETYWKAHFSHRVLRALDSNDITYGKLQKSYQRK